MPDEAADRPAPPAPPSPPAPGSPPWFGAGSTTDGTAFFSRQGLVRPAQGRYLGGVCAAIGRATNTDPVLWRVVLAVLGLLGVGILLYLVGWLIIPSEGDTASPVEAMLGRGQSQMSPIAVLILGGMAALSFAYVISNGFPGTLLGGAVLVGGLLLLQRNNALGGGAPAPAPAGTPDDAGSTARFPQPPPPSGYRPPFAPHGPYAGPQPAWRTAPPPPPKPAKPPRERSKLGRITFFLVLVAIGLVAVLDLGGIGVQTSTYFAAALVTLALGLLVGAWVGRARGLIVLALIAGLGLGASSAAEHWGVAGINDPVSWQPQTVAGIADRYERRMGEATLDLRNVDFAGQAQETSIVIRAGRLRVLLPPNVDTTAQVSVGLGSSRVFGNEAGGPDLRTQQVTDHGIDGPGGGSLRLTVTMDAGDVEVSR